MPEDGEAPSDHEQANQPPEGTPRAAPGVPSFGNVNFTSIRLSADFDPGALLTGPDAAEVSVCYERPDRGLVLVGIGEAARIDAQPGGGPEAIRDAALRLLRDGAPADELAGPLRPRLLGGFAFDTTMPAGGPWGGFDYGWLSLPRLLFVRDGDDCGVVLAPGAHPAEAEGLVERSTHAAPVAPKELPAGALRVVWDINRPALLSSVAEIAAEVREGLYEKAVLAAVREIEAARPIDPGRVLAQLRTDYPHCYLFSFRRGDAIFLGATPEQLAGLRHGAVSTLGLAGSARRGRSDEEDRLLGEELLRNAKERIEHEIVVRALREGVASLAGSLEAPNRPELLRLHNIQHLATEVRGRALPGVDILDLVERLHPTPAVCGWPVAPARTVIERHERFDRGWYAGPIGWMDGAGDGEFAVGLRSALIRGRRAWLFAGAGITSDSTANAELAEIELKLRPLTSALGGGAM